jgi:general secretion pathway protein J
MSRRSGFTLVEMLVALFIFGLLAAAGVTVMGYAIDSQAQVRTHMDRTAEFQRMRAILKADLAQAAPRRTRGLDGQPSPSAFIGGGTGGALLILTRRGWENLDGRSRASLQYVEYRLVDDRLERATRSALDGAPLGPPQILYQGVSTVQPAFLSRGEWTPTWLGDRLAQLPDAVRLDMELEEVGPVSQLFIVPAERAP